MPGLLQTEDYARAIFSTRFKATGDEIDELVAARMKRQKILGQENPPGLWVILDEWARTVADLVSVRGTLAAVGRGAPVVSPGP